MRAVIADDEAPARRIIRQYLAGFPEIEVVAEAANGIEAEGAVRGHRPDLLFLDVQMPGRTGFEVVDALRAAPPEAMPRVIFSTAYDQYAVRAFEVAAVDYLLKPYDRERFSEAVRRALASGDAVPGLDDLAALLDARQRPAYPDRLLVRDGVRVIPVQTAEVLWAEASGDFTTLHATGARAFPRRPAHRRAQRAARPAAVRARPPLRRRRPGGAARVGARRLRRLPRHARRRHRPPREPHLRARTAPEAGVTPEASGAGPVPLA